MARRREDSYTQDELTEMLAVDILNLDDLGVNTRFLRRLLAETVGPQEAAVLIENAKSQRSSR